MSASNLANNRFIACSTAGSSTPWSALNPCWPPNPAWVWEPCDARRSVACWLSEPGNENSSRNSPPADAFEHDKTKDKPDPGDHNAAAPAIHGVGKTLKHGGTSNGQTGCMSAGNGNATEQARSCRPTAGGVCLHQWGQARGGWLLRWDEAPTPADRCQPRRGDRRSWCEQLSAGQRCWSGLSRAGAGRTGCGGRPGGPVAAGCCRLATRSRWRRGGRGPRRVVGTGCVTLLRLLVHRVDAAHLEELQTQIADLGEQTVQGRLVGDRLGDAGLAVFVAGQAQPCKPG